MVLSLTGCATNTPAPTNDYCRLFEPHPVSKKDTAETRDWAYGQFGIYECVCKGNCPVDSDPKKP